ncbi:MAG TPA: FAD:protein FMN transferase [Actinoplanes sp.]|nr:FAD:protein FMN transferase [Actinoplanes sp.]
MTTQKLDPAPTAAGPQQSVTFTAMATTVTMRVLDPGADVHRRLDAARQVFERVETACTRFNPNSALMRANAAGDAWHRVPEECFVAVAEAARAHVETEGLFDPRVLDTLVWLGYDRTLPFRSKDVTISLAKDRPPRRTDLGVWRPGLDPGASSIRLGPHRIDLGGIGKGLAVRLAAAALAGAGRAHLVEAGGDCHVVGDGPQGDGWWIAVEDPAGGSMPVAVLQIRDTGCATSSVRVRTWQVNGRQVHHLIDPRTGQSARGTLRSVTVLDPDPARAEVWSKSLLIAGRDLIAELAEERALAALWVDDAGRVAASTAMAPSVIWSVPDVD